jgi:general secretion pathway protein D
MFTASVNEKDFSGILSLVRTFGATRILSSPRLTVLNNQTAVLKVARNEVYFLTSAQFPTTISAAGVPVSGTPVFSSTPRTVPVGLVMTVQPAIDAERGRVTMTLRPTISRVVDRVNDPSIGLNAAQSGVSNPVQSRIPVLAVREMDSVIQLNSGEVAIMGGLMQDSSQNQDQGVPPFDELPVVGNLAKSRDNQGETSELVILLRATILDNASPDETDMDLYERYNRDPRPLPRPRRIRS